MQSEWRSSTIGHEASILLGFAFKSAAFAGEPPGHRLLRGDNIKRGSIEWGEKTRFWRNWSSELERYLLRSGDVVVGMDGSRVGENFAVVTTFDLPALLVQRVACLRAKERLHQGFLRYLICNPEFTRYIKSVQTGTSIPHISGRQIADFAVLMPPMREQVVIASMLQTMDDRIDLLRQTNATLESVAQALFKSWFIDFDPVRAKAEGGSPDGMDVDRAALFPAEFEESALGLIPKGWRAATVADAVELNPTRSLSKGTDAHYLEMANAPTAGHRPLQRVELRTFGSGTKFRNGDALLAKITPCLENGKSAFVDFLDEDQIGWGSTEFIVMRAKPVLPQYGAYLLARYEPFRQFAIQAMTGTSGRQRVDLSRLAQFPMALPSDSSVASAAEPTLRALQSRIAANDEQSKSLAALRDAMLPRLMSGRLRLSEAQAQLEEAVA